MPTKTPPGKKSATASRPPANPPLDAAAIGRKLRERARASELAAQGAPPPITTLGARTMLQRILEDMADALPPELLDDDYGTEAEWAALEVGQTDAGDGRPSANNAGAIPRRLTVDLLRALDARRAWPADPKHPDRRRGFIGVPMWLHRADLRAEQELAAWYAARGLPSPDTLTDPGEPETDLERARELAIDFPRPAPETPDAQLVEYLKCRRSSVYFVDNYCWIEHKERGQVPFRLWRWQAWLLHRWHEHDLSEVLKARQIGVSELAAAGGALWLARFFDTKLILMISKGEDDAQVLLGRAKVSLDRLPEWMQPSRSRRHLNPAGLDGCCLGRDNTKVLELIHHDARWNRHVSRIESLPSKETAGRGRTAALVILDEWAHMTWPDQIWRSVKSTAGGGGRVFGISTANGMGNIFYEMWDAAIRDGEENVTAGANGFFPVFLSWRRHPGRDAAWYAREKATAEARGPKGLADLHQENPSQSLEAFIQSGRPVFDKDLLAEHQARIVAEAKARAAQGLPAWEEKDGLTVYEEPEAGQSYIVSADVAQGLEKGDWSDASVTCRETGREVAAMRGHWLPHVFAQKLDELAHRYNTALLAVELNNTMGGSALLALTQGVAHEMWAGARIAYPNMYHFTDDLRDGARQDRRAGWHTNIRTKPMLINELHRGLREKNGDGTPIYQPRSLRFLHEALIFANTEGDYGAPEGQHDDAVMSRGIGVYLLLRANHVAHTLAYIRAFKAQVEADVASGGYGRGKPAVAQAPTPGEDAPPASASPEPPAEPPAPVPLYPRVPRDPRRLVVASAS